MWMDVVDTVDPFEAALDAAIAELPEPFRTQLDSVAIVVDGQWPLEWWDLSAPMWSQRG